MDIISGSNFGAAEKAIAERLQHELQKGGVLWLLSGGSNIAPEVRVMQQLRQSGAPLENLSVGLVDERYGPIGHADSNWKQLIDAGFDTSSVHKLAVLTGASIEETTEAYAKVIDQAQAEVTVIVQLGIGTDGHIAGVLPHTPGVGDAGVVISYASEPYQRITLTLAAIKRATAAYVLAFGPSKKPVVERLRAPESLAVMPAEILTELSQAYVYTD